MKAFCGQEPKTIKASMPPFNKRTKEQAVDIAYPDIVELDVPCFGLSIVNATMALFDNEQSRHIADDLGVRIPKFQLNTFIQTKVWKVRTLIDEANRREDKDRGGNPEAIRKLRDFVDAFEKLSADVISSPKDWDEFVGKYIVASHLEDWQSLLHFDHVLSLFGFEPDTATTLRAHPYKDEGKDITLEQHSLRWLSKALSAYNILGTLTDVVNLIFAMLKRDKPTSVSEENITQVIQEFTTKLQSNDFKDMWIPDCMVFDGELDDMLAWLLLKYVHKCRNESKKPYVLAQLPPDLGEKPLDDVKKWLEGKNVQTFVDPNSRNGKTVKRVLGLGGD